MRARPRAQEPALRLERPGGRDGAGRKDEQNENTSVTVGVGDFQNANWVKAVTFNTTGNSSARMAYADLKLKFGGSN